MECKVAKIIKIDEPDFGCEGRPENVRVMGKILLEILEDHEQIELEVEEKSLWQMGLDAGMKVNLLVRDDGGVIIQTL